MHMILSSLRCGLVVLVLACVLLPTVSPQAQEAALSPEPSARAEAAQDKEAIDRQRIEDLLGTLEDPAAREKFIADLQALIAAQKQLEHEPEKKLVELPPPETLGARLIFAISAGIQSFSERLLQGVAVFKNLPEAKAWLQAQLSDRQARAFWASLLTKFVVLVLGGLVVEWIVGRLLARPRRRLESARSPHVAARLLLVVAHAFLDALPIIAFAATVYLILPFTGTGDRARFVVLAIVNAHIVVGITLIAARMLLMPTASALRPARLSDETAAYLYVWVWRLSAIVIYGYFLAEAAVFLGVDAAARDAFLKLVGLIAVSMLIVLMLQNRKAVSDWLRGHPDAERESTAFGVFRERFADVWHILACIYLAVLYLVWALDIGFAFLLRATVLTVLVLLVTKLLIAASTRVVARVFRISHEMTLRYPGLEARANRYLPVLGRVLRGVILAVAALFILQAWGVESLAWLTSPSGVRFIGTGLGIVVVLTIALIVWEMIGLGLDRYAARVDATSRSSARVRTLLPLLRTVILVVLSVMVGLVVLSQIGINITPLLAGAGVIGLAVGFGSQKLVQDVINGLFVLAEDTISVGDVVNLDGRGGLVEGMTIRHIRLRDFDGSVWTVPFSEVKAILNMTKDYSRYVLNVEVAYKEDVDRVIEVLKRLGDEMRDDPQFGPMILEPIEIVGLDKFGESSMVIKARLTTLPIKQWTVGREFNRRMKKRFDELGIEIPFPTRTIYYGREKDMPVYQAPAALVGEVAKVSTQDGSASTRPQEAAKAAD